MRVKVVIRRSMLALAVALAVSLTTLVSGGIMTALYIWRRDVSFLMLAHVITDLYGLVIAPLISWLWR